MLPAVVVSSGAAVLIRDWQVPRSTRQSYYAVKTALLERLRTADRTVVWTPQVGLGVGNQMYLWLNAFVRQQSGEDCRVLTAPGSDDWVSRFPALRNLVVSRAEVSLRDTREAPDEPWLRQRVGVDFTASQLGAFVEEALASGLAPPHGDSVINVRRGDFYGKYANKYGFDVEAYLDSALPGSLTRVTVVSDDPDWCREHLGALLARATHVDFAPRGPVSQFEILAGASDLYLTNSTFGYWGGYVASTRGARVTAPWLHARGVNGGSAYQLLPDWRVIGRGTWDGLGSDDQG